MITTMNSGENRLLEEQQKRLVHQLQQLKKQQKQQLQQKKSQKQLPKLKQEPRVDKLYQEENDDQQSVETMRKKKNDRIDKKQKERLKQLHQMQKQHDQKAEVVNQQQKQTKQDRKGHIVNGLSTFDDVTEDDKQNELMEQLQKLQLQQEELEKQEEELQKDVPEQTDECSEINEANNCALNKHAVPKASEDEVIYHQRQQQLQQMKQIQEQQPQNHYQFMTQPQVSPNNSQHFHPNFSQQQPNHYLQQSGSPRSHQHHQRRWSGDDLLKRSHHKLLKLEETCMERYVAREERVISTLNFCMTALEQLRKWAVFAIFPADEQHSDKYIGFVDERYSCVVVPLRIFVQAIRRENDPHTPVIGSNHRSSNSPRDIFSTSFTSSRTSPRDSLSGSSASSLSSPFGFCSSNNSAPRHIDQIGQSGSLRDRINEISHQYLQEGVSIKDLVVERLVKCRKEIRIIYRWGQSSLMDLSDVFDESLADELYYMVRGKMARVLSAISVFEESADQIERHLSNNMQHRNGDSDIYSEDGSMVPEDRQSPDSGRHSGVNLLTNGYDFRVDLQPLTSDYEDESPRRGSTHAWVMNSTSHNSGNLHLADSYGDLYDGDSNRDNASGSGSGTPEPPTSPRPRYLGSHPKIMKDKLQNLALPSKFPVSPRNSSMW